MSGETPSKTLDPSPVGSRVRSRTLDSMNSSSLSPNPEVEAESPSLDDVENASSGDEAEGSPLVGPVSRIGKRDVEEWRRKYDLPQDPAIRSTAQTRSQWRPSHEQELDCYSDQITESRWVAIATELLLQLGRYSDRASVTARLL
ncbi:hypothetical protein Rs2_29160 [Raphanus sativus]|nr:hypothetical protein Rs2_29160 [Raphanus sativus]